MTVYVDDMRARFGRLIMCHMIATDEDGLHAMADRIGVARKWYQGDHYDIALSKRALAVASGALEITWRQLACMSRYHRGMGAWLLPEDAEILHPALICGRIKKQVADQQEASTPFWAKCGNPSCGHCWVAAYTPMSLSKMATLLRGLKCPKCVSPKTMVAKQSAGVLLEPEPAGALP